MEKKNSP